MLFSCGQYQPSQRSQARTKPREIKVLLPCIPQYACVVDIRATYFCGDVILTTLPPLKKKRSQSGGSGKRSLKSFPAHTSVVVAKVTST